MEIKHTSEKNTFLLFSHKILNWFSKNAAGVSCKFLSTNYTRFWFWTTNKPVRKTDKLETVENFFMQR